MVENWLCVWHGLGRVCWQQVALDPFGRSGLCQRDLLASHAGYVFEGAELDIAQDSSLSPGLFGVEGRRCRGERVLFWDEVLEGKGGRGSRRRRIKVTEALWER